ncbi:hypothetical protein QTP86_017485 [Hemibagrus guttatus]|nr:hypothetical protein QTP86_017485 [Hemibagrus guttatus]
MPGMVMFRRRWSVGSDDLVLPAFFLFILHCIWLVVLSVVLFGLPYGSGQSCSITLVDHGRGYMGILISCLICESAIMWLSMRGSILYTQPREAVQYVLYIRLAILLVELVYAVVGIAWLVQYYQPCSDVTAKNLALGTTHSFRHRLEEGQASSWSRRLRFFMCCTRAKDTQSDAYSEVASLFAEFFRDLDIVPSDIIAGLVLLRQRQRAKRSAILDQPNNDILAFLSGVPVTRSTRYLDLKNSAEMAMYKEVCYYMLFAMAAYGWPVYLLRNATCGICRLLSSCTCTSGSRSRLSQSVTVEEDNCCGCNVLAIRRQFLDRDLKQVQIVYTSCHDAVYETPFYVAVDHGKKKVVISIRGTLSPKDALTDLTGDSERLPVEEHHGVWLGHKGMVYSAEYIKKKLEQEMILSQAFGRDLNKGTMHYGLVIVGHSLGAGTAAILSFLLRPQYPTLRCYAYSPPGGLLSEDAMEYSKEFVTSVVLGKDLVPRIGLSQLEGFRRHLLEVLQKSDKPKWRIIIGGTKCIPKTELPLEDDPPSQGVTPSTSRLCLHPSDLSIALSASTPLYLPGRIIHVVHNHPPESCCGQEDPTYSALWGDNKAFDEVIISPAMLNEHMPHVVLDGLNKVLENPFYLSEQIAAKDEESCAPALIFVDQTPPNSSLTSLLSHDSSVFGFSPVPSADSLLVTHTALEQEEEEEEEKRICYTTPSVPRFLYTSSLQYKQSFCKPPSIKKDLEKAEKDLSKHKIANLMVDALQQTSNPTEHLLSSLCYFCGIGSDGLDFTSVLENYNKGKTALLSAAKIMVSPTEVDLNAETYFHGVSNSHEPTPQAQHRRNSSVRSCARSEISLDGFSECPPPAVPVVLMGARERLALELRERKAPLAVMESLSDVDSVYSMDSRRSSAAFRGSPCLGTLPFPLDAPIPEENPSLSSRTELIQASPERELTGQTGPCCPTPPELTLPPNESHSLSPQLVVPSNGGGHFPRFTPKQTGEGQPGQQKALIRAKSETFEAFRRSNSKDSSPLAPWTGIIEKERRENPKNEGVKKEEKSKKEVRVAPLSNGNTSQAVLEFAQYLDSPL